MYTLTDTMIENSGKALAKLDTGAVIGTASGIFARRETTGWTVAYPSDCHPGGYDVVRHVPTSALGGHRLFVAVAK